MNSLFRSISPASQDPASRVRVPVSTGALSLSLFLGLLTCPIGAVDIATSVKPAGGSVDFKRDIQPLLSRSCFECHGEKKQKSGLRFDRRSGAFMVADSGKPAIVPGRSSESLMIQRVTTTDEDEVMPPKGERLSAKEVALLKDWIDQGAAWPDDQSGAKPHWAYVKPERPALPTVKNIHWPRNGIDFFVLSRLEKEGLSPSPEAERSVLLRRANLDLTGLPPTPEEVGTVLKSPRSDAYEAAVDRLLGSPRYGERWARPWLDLARYADTQGYEKDSRRTIWPYRDWVIQALNRNLPFDQFTIEQLAGDLLRDATLDQKIATGFHRNTMTNTEGGTDDEEFRHEALVDRINTTSATWLGTTIGCAQCHNHKYDPFTMKEYYQLYAFLNQTADNDQPDESPTLLLSTPEQDVQLKELRQRVAELDKALNRQAPELTAARQAWEEETSAALARWSVVKPVRKESQGGATLELLDDLSILAIGPNPSNDTYTIEVPFKDRRFGGLRLEVLSDPSFKGSQGRNANGGFILTRVEATITGTESRAADRNVTFTKASADYSYEGHSITNLIESKTGPGWAVVGKNGGRRDEQSAYLILSEPVDVPAGAMLSIRLFHESSSPEANLGRFRVSVASDEDPPPAPKVPAPIRTALLVPIGDRNDGQKKQSESHWRSFAPQLKDERQRLAEARKTLERLEGTIPRTAIMVELDKQRKTHMLIRGGFLSKGDPVAPGTPAVLHPLEASATANGSDANRTPNRLDLARWLVSPNNPLTARVIVNRLWEQYFGIGIVETSEDFGIQGEPPSHPELLDWLATEFMRQGWNLKAIHKLIATSATYRQSSKVDPELQTRDPYNRLLARGPRVRLDAEMIRDQALAVSGLLSLKLGGPSVMPPQPDGLWSVVYSGDRWETSKSEDRFRRGLYTFWRRSMPHPAMTTFDAPSREFCVLKRPRSNTPLQALVMMNDPASLEAARALAHRLLCEAPGAVEKRIERAYFLCFARPPNPEETSRLALFYRQTLDRFTADPEAAKKFISIEGTDKASDGDDPAELAAWTTVANVLLNLDEMITKG